MSAAAGVGRSVFITRDGLGFWCGKGMGDTKNVRMTVTTTVFKSLSFVRE